MTEKGSTRKTLTPDEVDRIIELKLQHVPVRNIAEEVKCSTNTVQSKWRTYLDSRLKERLSNNNRATQEIISRLEQNAKDARRGYHRATMAADDAAAGRFLDVERRAFVELAKLGVVPDSAPEQAGKVAAAEAASIAATVTAAVDAAGLDPADRARALANIVAGLRGGK